MSAHLHVQVYPLGRWLLLVLAVVLAGCDTTPQTIATVAAPPSPTAAAAPSPDAGAGNPFATLLGDVTLPPGWTVQPCEGQGPFLCVSEGGQVLGSVELLHYPLDQRQDVEQWMVEAGLEPGRPFDPADPEQARRAREALHALRDDHMGVVQEDRAQTYPEGRTFTLLEPEEVQVGALPGLFYGFAGIDQDGRTFERWLTYAALDGENLYIFTAFYAPGDTPGSFPSDETLLAFAPVLREIVAALRLPDGAS